MPNSDASDKKAARQLALVLVVAVAVLIGAALLMLPALAGFVATSLTPGLDLRGAALSSFFITVLLFIVFAVVSGDGLIGELQFMLAAFFSFFLILTLLLAWIF